MIGSYIYEENPAPSEIHPAVAVINEAFREASLGGIGYIHTAWQPQNDEQMLVITLQYPEPHRGSLYRIYAYHLNDDEDRYEACNRFFLERGIKWRWRMTDTLTDYQIALVRCERENPAWDFTGLV